MSDDTPRRPEHEDLPGAGAPAEPGGGWLPPTDAPADRDPTGRLWTRQSTGTDEPAGAAPWPGAEHAPPPHEPRPGTTPAWPAGGATTVAGLPQGVRPASFGARAQAAVVDFFVRLALVLAGSAAGALLFLAGETAGVIGLVIGIGIGFVAGLAYAPLMMTRTGGQTVGHKASGTRIVTRDGVPVTGGQAVLRELVVKWLVIDAVGGSFVLPTLLNYLWPLWDEHNEALHDKLCKTRVVEA